MYGRRDAKRRTMKQSALVIAAVMVPVLSGAVRAEASESATPTPIDSFSGLTHLGNQFQIDSGKLGETHFGGAAVRDYAKLMDTSQCSGVGQARDSVRLNNIGQSSKQNKFEVDT
jgi:predicted outer membrane protein